MPSRPRPAAPRRPSHPANRLYATCARHREFGIRLFDIDQDGSGIVHIVGPELALTLPGAT
jgi:3-isopropylmalate/(R)-2-methylmalate dehydratase large subunit